MAVNSEIRMMDQVDEMLRRCVALSEETGDQTMASIVKQLVHDFIAGILDIHTFIQRLDAAFGNRVRQTAFVSALQQITPRFREAIRLGRYPHWSHCLGRSYSIRQEVDRPVSQNTTIYQNDWKPGFQGPGQPLPQGPPKHGAILAALNRPTIPIPKEIETNKRPSLRFKPPTIAPPTLTELEIAKRDSWINLEAITTKFKGHQMELNEKEKGECLVFVSEFLESKCRQILTNLQKQVEHRKRPPDDEIEIIRDPLKELKVLDKYYRKHDSSNPLEMNEKCTTEIKAIKKKQEDIRRTEDINAAALAALGHRPNAQFPSNFNVAQRVRPTINDLLVVFDLDPSIRHMEFYKALLICPPATKFIWGQYW
ncbi:hypothetical protein FO519_006656 [Halicephalobus sp. NKZ332]|nr:hypothetical protein FO519_006656 [Halicephalobus sp. NKZ332]